MPIEYLFNSITQTSQFLDILRQLGAYKFRKNIRLSDVELAKNVEENSVKITAAIRDGIIMDNFIKSKELVEDYEQYHAVVMEELKKFSEEKNA